MKKVGLCVRYDCNNYGSMLQILATIRAIEQHDVNVEVIRYDKRTLSFMLSNILRVFNPYFMKSKIDTVIKKIIMLRYPEIKESRSKRISCFKDFRTNNLGPYSEVFRGYDNLKKAAYGYDCIIAGSDQLWTPAGLNTSFYNLIFVPDSITKISFATSFGVSSIPWWQQRKTGYYLNRIDYLSVREKRGAEMIKEIAGRESVVLLDPTMMFDSSGWDELVERKPVIHEGKYIFAFFLGEERKHRVIVNELKKESGLSIVTCPYMEGYNKADDAFGDIRIYDAGPKEFLNLIRYAELICTDSFHGTVFSILNHKLFLTFDRFNNQSFLSRNSRIDTLLSMLDLEDRRYTGNGVAVWNKCINYDDVDRVLDEKRKEANDFLNEALSNGSNKE